MDLNERPYIFKSILNLFCNNPVFNYHCTNMPPPLPVGLFYSPPETPIQVTEIVTKKLDNSLHKAINKLFTEMIADFDEEKEDEREMESVPMQMISSIVFHLDYGKLLVKEPGEGWLMMIRNLLHYVKTNIKFIMHNYGRFNLTLINLIATLNQMVPFEMFLNNILQVLKQYLKNLTNEQSLSSEYQRNVICLIKWVLEENDSKIIRHQASIAAQLIQAKIANQRLLLFSIVCLEMSFVSRGPERSDLNGNEKLLGQLKLLARDGIYLESNIPAGEIPFKSARDRLNYQVSFCASWFLNNLIQPKSLSSRLEKNWVSVADQTECIKLSPCLLSIRSDYGLESVRYSFRVESSVYFYEAHLITNGEMRFGWATAQCKLSEVLAIGDDAFSIGYDGSQLCVFHNARKYDVPNLEPEWCQGDVVGCLINVQLHIVIFYLNGKQMIMQPLPPKARIPFFPAMSLNEGEHCFVNFGQFDFQYPPIKYSFKNFYQSLNEDNSGFSFLSWQKLTKLFLWLFR